MQPVLRFLWLGLVAPAASAAPWLPYSADRYVRAEIELNRLPGLAVAVVRGAEIALAAYGVRSLATGEPMTPETLVELASLSKPLTALAIARLEQEGALDLDRPVRDYLPEFKVRHSHSDRITVRHLVEHTSGLIRADDPLVLCSEQPGQPDLSWAVQRLRQARPRYRPGERFRYANCNYILLAALIERLSGRPFALYMRERVFRPLGMLRTTLDGAEALGWGLAAQHERQWGRFRISPERFSRCPGASLVKSSAQDVGQWLSSFLRGAPGFGPAGAASRWLDNRRQAPYQMGWYVHRGAEWLPGGLALEHTGFIWGANTAAVVVPSRQLAVAVLINAGTTRAGPIARGLAARLLGLPGPPPQRAPFTAEADNWAPLIAAAGAILAAVTLVSGLRAWGEWRAGRRRLHWRAAPLQTARSLLLVAMAVIILYLLHRASRSPWPVPASVHLAVLLLGLATAALLLVLALLGVTPRLPPSRGERLGE